MIRPKILGVALMVAFLLGIASSAQAEFGLVPGSLKADAVTQSGTKVTQASSHPFALTVHFDLKSQEGSEDGRFRNAIVDFPPGLVGNPRAVPQCTRKDFETPQCPAASQVGVLRANIVGIGQVVGPIYNLEPPPGVATELGFNIFELVSLQFASVRTEEGYGLRVAAINAPAEITSVTETIWGVPAASGHDSERGEGALNGGPPLASDAPELAYLTMPASCDAAPQISLRVNSFLDPSVESEESTTLLDGAGDPSPLTGCAAVPFSPKISTQPSSRLASNPSGLDFELKLPNASLSSPGGIAETVPRKTVVTLPEGVTINPSFAEGIGTCSPAQYSAEKINSAPGAGCPETSKLGSVIAQTPLLEEPIEGSIYVATPYDNPFGTLTALYMVARAPERGILVKQAGRVSFDSSTGQITTTFDDLPPLPYSSFKLHFREGGRAPLVTPASCGEYETVGRLTPFSATDDSEAVETRASFQIERGSDGGACPPAGLPAFHPALTAGTINNAAGSFSPFNVGISRNDSEQEITHFSIKLPPGVTGKLAGIPFCSDLQIAAAKARERQPQGGQEELDAPSCPAASEVGHTLVGSGVGGTLIYVPGRVYLAGPYNGDSLSIVAITSAKAGPFDLGTVVVREGLEVNPETAEVFVDATGSDPIPHIINGIPVHLRDVRVYVDRPGFVLNPTNCKTTSTASTVLGSGLDFASKADDRPVTVTTRFQAADCAALAYKPRLKLKLKGSTKRGGNPALIATLRPRANDANSKRISVALPHSEFLEQAHIKTICTRVQFNAGAGNGAQCPAAAVYGQAKVWTPLLSEPLTGPVFLRSSEHPLPDLVIALHGLIDFTAVGRIDSVNGGIRNTFETVPDAPIEKVELRLGGGKKSLLANSVNLCAKKHSATAKFNGQNGRRYTAKVPLQPRCKGKHKKKNKRHRRAL